MDLYLVQHGESKSKEEDPERSLTDEGRLEVERMAQYAAGIGLQPGLIYHSGKLRAEQTAGILARALLPSEAAKELPGLAPNDDPEIARTAVEEAGKPLMLVGHLPHLSRLAALLVTGDPDREIVAFQNGGIVSLRQADGVWRLSWILVPDILPQN